MSQLQVTKITTVDNTTPLILATGNSGGGQIIIQSANTDVSFSGNINFNGTVTGDGTYLRLPSSNVANAAFNTANAAFASANNVAPQVTPAFNTANNAYLNSNVAFNTANAAFASANNVAPQVTPSYNTANAAFNTANAAYNAANNVGPQIAPTFNTANSAFATANLASNTATGAYNTANAAYNNANAAFNAANGKFSSSGGTISGAVEITADLTVHGNTRFIDQQTLSVGDPLIYLAANNYSSDVVDIGFVANYVNSTSSNVHTGLFRSSGTKEYYLFYGYDKEPAGNYIDPTGNNIQQAVLNSTLRTSNVILGGANAINWITAAYAKANASGANVGQTAPTGVTSGKLWWNSDLGKLFVYYTDPANTSSWIETSPSASAIEGSIITGYINPVFNTVNAAYTFANSAYASINSNWTVGNTAYTVANLAYGVANTALQNTSGTFAGQLTVTGSLIAGGQLKSSSQGGNFIYPADSGYEWWTGAWNDYVSYQVTRRSTSTGTGYPYFTIDTAGRVGIGTYSPTTTFQVNGTFRTSSNNFLGAAVSGSSPMANDIAANAAIRIGNNGGDSLFIGQYANSHSWLQASYQNASMAMYNLVFQPLGGNVGVGVITPVSTFQVGGRATAEEFAYKQLKFDGSGTDLTATGASEAAYRVSGGMNMKNLGMFQFRGGSQYLHLKTNWTADNLMYQFYAIGYLYNNGNVWSVAGGYTYQGGIIQVYNSNLSTYGFNGAYRGSGGYLCLRLARADSGYSEGYVTIYAHTWIASEQNSTAIIAYSQNNTAGNYY